MQNRILFPKRWFGLYLALCLLLILIILSAQEYFPFVQRSGSPLFTSPLVFGFSLISLPLHFGLGAALLLYGSRSGINRWRTYSLVGFCWSWCYTLVLTPGWDIPGGLSKYFGAPFNAIAVILLTVFLCLYPRNLFSKSHPLFRGYSLCLLLIGLGAVLGLFFFPNKDENIYDPTRISYVLFYIFFPFTCIIRMILILREKQQIIHQRLLIWGVVFSVGPTFLLFILPSILDSTIGTNIDLSISPLFIHLLFLPLPLIITYNILRDQLLLDRSMRNMIMFLTWISSILLSCVLLFYLLTLLQGVAGPLGLQVGIVLFLLLVPGMCWWMQRWSQKLLASPLAQSQRTLIDIQDALLGWHMQEPPFHNVEILDQLHKHLWMYKFMSLFFWLEEEHQHLLLAPIKKDTFERSAALAALLERLGLLRGRGESQWIEIKPPERPVWLRHLYTIQKVDERLLDPLLFPVHSSSRLIGIFVLARREPDRDTEPDLDIAEVLISRWSLLLERLHLEEHLYQHLDVFRSLLGINCAVDGSVEQIASSLVLQLQEIFEESSCEIWIGNGTREPLVFGGATPSLFESPAGHVAWDAFSIAPSPKPYFSENEMEGASSEQRSTAFACFPLISPEGKALGMLIVSGDRYFAPRYRSLLETVARRVAFFLAHAQNIDLLRAEIKTVEQRTEEGKTYALDAITLNNGSPALLQSQLSRWKQQWQDGENAASASLPLYQREILAILDEEGKSHL